MPAQTRVALPDIRVMAQPGEATALRGHHQK
jgi:hypothetical protein